MDVLNAYCPLCGTTGEIKLLLVERQIEPEFFEQECIYCDCKLKYLRAHLTDLKWLEEDDLKEYLQPPG